MQQKNIPINEICEIVSRLNDAKDDFELVGDALYDNPIHHHDSENEMSPFDFKEYQKWYERAEWLLKKSIKKLKRLADYPPERDLRG